MKKIELYIDRNGRITLNEYESLNSINKSLSLKSIEAYEYLKKLSRVPIRRVRELPNDSDVLLVHKDFVLDIKDYVEIFQRNGTTPLLNNIKKYYEYENLKKVKGKKVTRKNKYLNKKIAMLGITFTIVTSCFFTGLASTKASSMSYDSAQNNQIFSTNNYFIPESSSEIKNSIIGTSNIINNVQELSISNIEDSSDIFIDYGDNSETEKAFKTQNNYGYLIEKYSDLYGLDSRLMTAIATQERGEHSEVMDPGGGIGLMQVQKSVWSNQSLTAYNFQTNEYETVVVDPDRLSELEYNIKVGCMIFQSVMRYLDYNVLASIQGYNMGIGSMDMILEKYAIDTNRSVNEILKNQNDHGWLDYRRMITAGDVEYVEHVLSWIGPNVNIKNIKEDGEVVSLSINNKKDEKIVY